MSADRYNRLVAYLNSPERVTLWEHRRLSQPYLWGTDALRESVRSITGFAMRTAVLFRVDGSWNRPGRVPVESDVFKALRMIYIARGLAAESKHEPDTGLSPLPTGVVREFFQRWHRSYIPLWQDLIDSAIHRYARRSIEVKRFLTLGGFYTELWHRLKSTFAFYDAPTCEFEDLPSEFSALIRTRNVSADATDQLRLAISREAGSVALRFGAVQHEFYARASEGWSTIDIPGLQGQELDVEIIDEGPVAGFTHIEEHGFEVD